MLLQFKASKIIFAKAALLWLQTVGKLNLDVAA
jgi:hypothetical protein